MDKKDLLLIKKLETSDNRFVIRIGEQLKIIVQEKKFKNKLYSLREQYNIPEDGFAISKEKFTEVEKRLDSSINESDMFNDNADADFPFELTDLSNSIPESIHPSKWLTFRTWSQILLYYLYFNDIPDYILKENHIEIMNQNTPNLGRCVCVAFDPELTKPEVIDFLQNNWENKVDPQRKIILGKNIKKRIRQTMNYERDSIIKETYHMVKHQKKPGKSNLGDEIVRQVMDALPPNLQNIEYETVRKVIYG